MEIIQYVQQIVNRIRYIRTIEYYYLAIKINKHWCYNMLNKNPDEEVFILPDSIYTCRKQKSTEK